MARIRSIKPEFWTSEQVMECSLNARLLFIGMWNFADDTGRLPYSPKTLKAQIFPSDDLEVESVRRMLNELSSNGLILVYAVDGKEYLQITGWQHQRIDRPQPSKYPAPFVDDSGNVRGIVATDRIGGERKGKEDISTVASATRRNEDFEEFWKVYPRRDGSNPKAPAEKLFLAAVKQGVNPKEIVAGARRCAQVEAKNVGTPYIPQAVKWLRDKRWNDYLSHPTISPALSIVGEKIPIEEAVAQFAKLGRLSRYSPINDISQAPPELLAKHGLLPDGRKSA